MNNEEAVEPQNEMDQILEQPEVVQEVDYEKQIEDHESRTQVPLSALQKERKKRQEAELRAEYLERQHQAAKEPVEEDNSAYESATRADLKTSEFEIIRRVEENLWIKNNAEKMERINQFLPEFLKQRPHLAKAINDCTNRYEEAFELMDKLTPKQQTQIAKASVPKREAPNSPSGVPKAAALNEAVDVMGMDDAEFNRWRQAQKKRR